MSNRRFEMYHYYQVITRMRLGDSDRSIHRAGLMGRSKAAEVRKISEEQGWLDKDAVLPDEKTLQEVFGQKKKQDMPLIEPYKEQVRQWFEEGISGVAIHQALVRNHEFKGSYSCVRRYLQTLKRTKPTVVLKYAPGEAAQVDFGSGPRFWEKDKEIKSWVFVMTLAWSRHMYAEIVLDHKIESWLGCHKRAFEFFEGVPEKVIIDNLRSAIVKACYYEPCVQRSYAEMASFYGFRISPCPVRDPQKKGRVESGVKYIKRNFLALREFKDLADANRQIKEWNKNYASERIHGSIKEKPIVRFEETEAGMLRSLPEHSWELSWWAKAKVHGNCHIQFEKSFYSVPYKYIHETVWIRTTEKTVEIYHNHDLIAMHIRSRRAGNYATCVEHYPPEATSYLMRDPQYCLKKAEKIGEACHELVMELFADKVLDKLRAAQGVLRLKSKYGAKRLEEACKRALAYKSPTYKTVKQILQNGQENLPLEANKEMADVYKGQGKFCRKSGEFLQ